MVAGHSPQPGKAVKADGSWASSLHQLHDSQLIRVQSGCSCYAWQGAAQLQEDASQLQVLSTCAHLLLMNGVSHEHA